MRLYSIVALLLFTQTAHAEDDCRTAANKALDATMAATTTLALASKYMSTHDDWCEGGTVQALEQADGEAVDHAWSQAIAAQSICAADTSFRDQMAKLIVTLHNRRLRIDGHLADVQAKCN